MINAYNALTTEQQTRLIITGVILLTLTLVTAKLVSYLLETPRTNKP